MRVGDRERQTDRQDRQRGVARDEDQSERSEGARGRNLEVARRVRV